MIIRKLELKDIKEASKIVWKNYSEEYEKSSYLEMEAMFKNYIPPLYLVAEEKNKIIWLIGYIQSRMDYNVYNIFWVNVDKDYQWKGIGTKLVKEVINIIKKKRNANMILLTATKENTLRYEKNFQFKVLSNLKNDKENYNLMGLKI